MTQEKIDSFILANSKYFPVESIYMLKEKLANVPDDKMYMLHSVEMKDPTTMLLISLFVGGFGVDRFMLGETGMGVLKLLTGGLFGIMTIIDWFSITKKTKELNLTKILAII